MSNGPLRIEQYETVRYDINCNPLGVPESVTRAIMENLSAIGNYPDTYYAPLKPGGCGLCRLCTGASGTRQRKFGSAPLICCPVCTEEGTSSDSVCHRLRTRAVRLWL